MAEKAKRSDFKELLKFENRAFKINFEKKVPRVYSFADCTDLHGVVRDGEKIVGGICVLPGTQVLGDERLATAGIGSVAVAKSHRGRGIMKELMQYAEKASLDCGAEIGFLSGYRLRYERFGYVPAGVRHVFEVTDHLIAHTPADGFSFCPAKGKEELDEIAALHAALPVRHEREREKLGEILSMWHSEAFLVRDSEGSAVGYLVFKKDEGAISELVLKDARQAKQVLVAFAVSRELKRVFVWLCPFQRELIRTLLTFGEHYRIEAPESLKIFNFKSVIEKFLRFRAASSPLQNGVLVLRLGEETLKISVNDGGVSVEETEETPDLTFSATEGTLMLTRPEGALSDNALFNAWSPLCPFGMFSVDTV